MEENKCGECNLCCRIPLIVELKKPSRELCKHYCNGCDIYEDRPKECSTYRCAFVQMKEPNINVRPDVCGIMFEKLTDNIFFGIIDPENTVSDIGKAQAVDFAKQGFSVLLEEKGEIHLKLILSENHDKEDIMKEFNEYQEMR